MVKVLLIVVQGKPEGKTIPLAGPVFRIGRGAECHLRPNSEEISRQHAEITVSDGAVTIRDLGSRNGTRVNGKLLTEPHTLKSGELIQLGPLTFAVSIQGAPSAMPAAPAPAPAVAAAADGSPQEQIEPWLVAGSDQPTPDRPSGVYDGDTLTISAYREKEKDKDGAARNADDEKEPSEGGLPAYLRGNLEFEALEEGTGDPEEEPAAATGEEDETETAESSMPEELLDESNPFYVAKKAQTAAETEASKASYKDSSDAASDILRKMLDRRRAR